MYRYIKLQKTCSSRNLKPHQAMTILKNKALCFLLLWIVFLCLTVHSRRTNERKYDSRVMERRFKSWLEHHNKHYKDRDEWMLRFGIYQANLDFIEFFNSQNLSYQLGDNEFADLTNDEFNAMYVGKLKLRSTRNRSAANSTVSMNLEDLPKELDWRKKGAVNEIKNQGKCGSCWAFATTSSIESMHQIKTGKLVSLSEQELVDCDTEGWNNGCRGGTMEQAFKFIKSNNGISTEKDYPYTAARGSCQAPKEKAVQISGYKKVPSDSESSLLKAVAQQPVAVAVDSKGSPFQLYSKGIFKGNCTMRVTHAVTLVGYGEEEGVKYWLVRNSWGPSWGEQGYMKLLRDAEEPEGACGVATMPSYPLPV